MFIESVFGMVGADTRALWADISERRVVAPPHNIYPWVEAGQAYHDILYVGGITDRNDGLIGLRTARPERSVTTYALAQTDSKYRTDGWHCIQAQDPRHAERDMHALEKYTPHRKAWLYDDGFIRRAPEWARAFRWLMLGLGQEVEWDEMGWYVVWYW